MPDQWMIRATTFSNCNCEINCGCQFNQPTTHGFCDFIMGGIIEEGHYDDVTLDGLKYVVIFAFPGEIAEGNGRRLMILDENANTEQRVALEKIVSGVACEQGATHFFIFSTVCSEFLETQWKPIEIAVDIEARTGILKVPGMVDVVGRPEINVHSGDPYHIAITRTAGSFEYTYAELGRASATVTGPIEMKLEDSYGQFCTIHFDQDGLVQAS